MCGRSKIISLALPWGTVAWLTTSPISQLWVCRDRRQPGEGCAFSAHHERKDLAWQCSFAHLWCTFSSKWEKWGVTALCKCPVVLCMASWFTLGQAVTSCTICTALKGYTEIKLSASFINTMGYNIYMFWWKKLLDWIKAINNDFGADCLWRTSKRGCCSGLSYGLAIAAKLIHAPYMIEPGVFLGLCL